MNSALLLTAALAAVGGGEDMKDLLDHDFRGGKFPETVLTRYGPTPPQFMTGEAEGLRITLPAQGKPIPPVGIACKLAVHGDFEITVSYEILRADKPPRGYGLGVSLHIAADTAAADNATLARFIHPAHGEVYATDRGDYVDGKGKHKTLYRPTAVKWGRLRLVRIGATLKYLAAGADDTEFLEVRDEPFVAVPLKGLRVTADTGNSTGEVDIRINELHVRSRELSVSPAVTRSGISWTRWAIGASSVGGVVIIAGGVLARSFWRKKRLAGGN